MTVQELRHLLYNVKGDAEVYVSNDDNMETGDEVVDIFIQVIKNEVTLRI